VTDSDLCLFDEELMVLGLRWRFMQANGMGYQDVKQEFEKQKGAAVSRYQPNIKFSLAGGSYYPAGLFPNVPLGNFTF
jgi:hypothetical protein